jgi:alkylation response protein AidB-like acyl-CoA dehydrogenase
MSDAKTLLAANQDVSAKVLGPAADAVDQSRSFPRENLKALGRAGLMGLLIPAEFGGAGASLAEMSQAVETQAQYCSSTAMIILMHYCATAIISAKGSDVLKRQVLPAAARGEHLGTLAFSESGSGGHFYIPVSEVSKNGAGKHLSASKSFVTSAGEADNYVVSARKVHAAGPTDSDLYLVPKTAAGLGTSGRFEGLGLTANASAPMSLVNVALDEASLLGAEGTGFQTMMEVVLPHFQIGAASVSVGIATAAFQAAIGHVTARKYEHAGGAALATIPRVQFLTAEMAIELGAARAYLKETIRKATSGDPTAMLDVLGVKAKCSEAAGAVVSRAMTLGGGWAFGRRGGLERTFRDAQAAGVMAPASDVLKEFIGKACLGLPLF